MLRHLSRRAFSAETKGAAQAKSATPEMREEVPVSPDS
jgi:hypothetical protein